MSKIINQGAVRRVDTYRADDNKLTLSMGINDAKVRQQAPQFDGLESAFALVPTTTESGVEWKRHALGYSGTDRMGSTPKDWEDMHTLNIEVSDETRELVRDKGVAFGLETNVGTLWLQNMGENMKG